MKQVSNNKISKIPSPLIAGSSDNHSDYMTGFIPSQSFLENITKI